MTNRCGFVLAILVCLPAAGPAAEEHASNALASVAAIQDDFERNASLYRLAANADEAELRRLFAELEQQPPTPHRYDIARVLYIRYVAVDPTAAVSHALRRASKPSWIGAVFRAWAHVDLEAAVAHAAGLNGEALRIASAAILELDLDAEQRALVVEQLQAEAVAQHASTWAARTTDTDDMAAAWNRALQSGGNVREQLEAVAIAWAAVAPREAMAMAAKLDHSLRHSMELAIFGHWDSNDPTGPIEWLETTAPKDRIRNLIGAALRHLARSDIDAALAKVDELPAATQNAALSGVFEYISAHQPQRAFEHFQTLDFGKQMAVLMQVAFVVPPHPDNVVWVGTIHPKLRKQALDMVLHRMYVEDAALAVRLTDEISDPQFQAQWARSLAPREAQRDPNEAWRWATSLPTELQEASGAVDAVFSAWYWIDRESAARNLLALRKSRVRDEALLATIQDFIEKPADYDHSLIDRFLSAVSDADAKREAASALRDHYTKTDPNPVLAERYLRQSR